MYYEGMSFEAMAYMSPAVIEEMIEQHRQDTERLKSLAAVQIARVEGNDKFAALKAEYEILDRVVTGLSIAVAILSLVVMSLSIAATGGTTGLMLPTDAMTFGFGVVFMGGLWSLCSLLSMANNLFLPGYATFLKTSDGVPQYVDENEYSDTKPKSGLRAVCDFIVSVMPATLAAVAVLTVLGMVMSNPVSSGIFAGLIIAVPIMLALAATRSYFLHRQMNIGYQLNGMLLGREILPNPQPAAEKSLEAEEKPLSQASRHYLGMGMVNSITACLGLGSKQNAEIEMQVIPKKVPKFLS